MSAAASLVLSDIDTSALNSPTVLFDEAETREHAVAHGNELFAGLSAADRVAWALEHLPGEHVLTSSFGIQAAVLLHLVTRHRPDIPVVFIDTGYLFPETYQFVDALSDRLNLNLKTYRNPQSPAWQEARYGRRWQQGLAGIEIYNRENKVEPMERALRELDVGSWFAGLRRSQSSSRANVPFLCPSSGPGRQRALEGPPDRRLDGPGRVPLPEAERPALSPALGAGLHLGGRRAHHQADPRGEDGRGNPLLRPEARVRPARHRPVGPVGAPSGATSGAIRPDLARRAVAPEGAPTPLATSSQPTRSGSISSSNSASTSACVGSWAALRVSCGVRCGANSATKSTM